MKILAITSILPVPGVLANNDFVIQTYLNYKQLYKDDSIVIIKPVRYQTNLSNIINRTTFFHKLKKNFTGEINGFKVEILYFLSAWRLRNLHALITASLYYLNYRKLTSLFSTYHFDIIHAQFILPDGLLACILSRKYGIPYVVTTHNERFYFEHYWSRKIALKILRNARMTLPINHSNYLYYKSIKLPNVQLTPLGFSNSFVRAQKSEFSKKISILTVAELIKLKNIDKVLYAIKELLKRYDIRYTLIGRGPERENLLKLTDQLQINENVSFIDHIPNELLADEMHKHNIFIMPSYFETFGRVYFEAMAMGIPIICAENSGIYGIFKEGVEGFSVDHENIGSIVNALEYLIINPEERLRIGYNGKKLVERYTWENIAKDLKTKYTEIIREVK